ncbi:SprT family zinc-dependent metalloprotease [Marinospirillum sp.]|uniref:SprT family zinc-dependent metalloprotease n=1 Tax=Marinospirillum sp. TaxID=2183934 RepID=UPI003A841C4D
MSDLHTLFTELKTAVSHHYQLAETYYLRAFPRPEVTLNLRGRSAGVAEGHLNRLRFNQQLLLENRQDFIRQVVPHEVAHLLSWQLYGRRIQPHGHEWRSVMEGVFKQPAHRTHTFDVRQAARQEFIYHCACADREHHLTVRRHNKIRRGQGYLCRLCGGPLHFVRQEKGVTH